MDLSCLVSIHGNVVAVLRLLELPSCILLVCFILFTYVHIRVSYRGGGSHGISPLPRILQNYDVIALIKIRENGSDFAHK